MWHHGGFDVYPPGVPAPFQGAHISAAPVAQLRDHAGAFCELQSIAYDAHGNVMGAKVTFEQDGGEVYVDIEDLEILIE